MLRKQVNASLLDLLETDSGHALGNFSDAIIRIVFTAEHELQGRVTCTGCEQLGVRSALCKIFRHTYKNSEWATASSQCTRHDMTHVS